ncbi:MAG: acetyltransferase [Proteobacteria bacterium]|nr:acetyltransferase [Pseudomonadota bacterium]
MSSRLYLVGGGGHCRACIDVIEAEDRHRIAGIVDLPARLGEAVLGYRVTATDPDLERLAREECGFLVTIGHLGPAPRRLETFAALQRLGTFLPTVVSPLAHLSRHARVGEGTIVMHGVIVNAAATVGVNAILNTGAIVEHDARVGDHCHISTGAVVNGGCRVGARTFVGSNSVLVHGVSVAADVVVGAGSVVHRDLTEPGVYAGNPCTRLR